MSHTSSPYGSVLESPKPNHPDSKPWIPFQRIVRAPLPKFTYFKCQSVAALIIADAKAFKPFLEPSRASSQSTSALSMVSPEPTKKFSHLHEESLPTKNHPWAPGRSSLEQLRACPFNNLARDLLVHSHIRPMRTIPMLPTVPLWWNLTDTYSPIGKPLDPL